MTTITTRKSRSTAGRATNNVAPQENAVLTQAQAIQAFENHVTSYRRQSLHLVCSAAVCLIVATHAGGDKVDQTEMIEKLKAAVARHGLQDAQVNKYIGIGREIVNHLLRRFKVGGPVIDVVRAITADAAIDALAAYFTKQKVTTLEGMTKLFGKYKRTKHVMRAARTNGAGAPAAPATNGHAEPGAQPAALSLVNDNLIIRMKTLPTDFLVLTAAQAGHALENVAIASIKLIVTENDLDAILSALVDRRKQLETMEHTMPVETGINALAKAVELVH